MKIFLLATVIAMSMVITTALDGRRSKRQLDYQPEISNECKRLGYCVSVSNYPDDLVKQLIHDNSDKIFTMDRLDNSTEGTVSRVVGAGSHPTVPLCEARTTIIYPQAAPDESNVWRTIVNPKDNPVQGIKVEICNGPGLQCSSIMCLEQGYTSECQQKYVYRTVATFDKGNNNILNSALKFPSCCSCVLHTVN